MKTGYLIQSGLFKETITNYVGDYSNCHTYSSITPPPQSIKKPRTQHAGPTTRQQPAPTPPNTPSTSPLIPEHLPNSHSSTPSRATTIPAPNSSTPIPATNPFSSGTRTTAPLYPPIPALTGTHGMGCSGSCPGRPLNWPKSFFQLFTFFVSLVTCTLESLRVLNFIYFNLT